MHFCGWLLHNEKSCSKKCPWQKLRSCWPFWFISFFDSLPIASFVNAGVASVDWRLDCLRVSQRRAAECPPCSEEWLQLMACRNLKPVKFFIHQESSRLFTLRVVTFPSIPSQFCGAKILSKTDGEVRSCRRIPPILITMPTWLHGCVRQACHRGYEVALPKKVLLK